MFRIGTPSARPAARHAGFSLLELMIVLGIMVGVAALTFPRLTRPLAETEAHEAANRLREALTDCRRSAALRGEPLFLRLVAGETRVEWGDWSVLLSDGGLSDGDRDDAGTRVGTGRSPADAANDSSSGEVRATTAPSAVGTSAAGSSPHHSIVLPHEVVVEAVRWGRASPSSSAIAGEEETAGRADPTGTDAGSPSVNPSQATASSPAAGPLGADAVSLEGQWYLPFLPSGRTRNCQIILRDTLIGTRLMLELDAVTGMTRIERLTSATANATAGGA